eukprot:521096-Rhodomonas_salina.1
MGRLADPRVFMRALSATEIAAIYAGSLSAPTDLKVWAEHTCNAQCARTVDTTCSASDECVTGSHNCDAEAACADTVGSFMCTCNSGYVGSGISCSDVDECGPQPPNLARACGATSSS